MCGKHDRLVRDHCHASGLFRGWVCTSCNLILGLWDHERPGTDQLYGNRIAEYLKVSGVTQNALFTALEKTWARLSSTPMVHGSAASISAARARWMREVRP